MTHTKNYKETEIGGTLVWCEEYRDKGMPVYMWRYGYIGRDGLKYLVSDNLMSRPNLRRLFAG